ncbi:MAG: cyclic lactone autoinducer peptide [Bacillota bacterium]
MKRFLYSLLPAAFSVLAVAAFIGVKPLCGGIFYQPEVPKALRK